MCVISKIQIEQYVAEYYIALYYDSKACGVRFPDNSDIYITIYDLMNKRPAAARFDKGNFPIVLPDRREANRALGKSPEQYNYLSERAAAIISKRLKTAFWAQVHEMMDEQHHLLGYDYKDIAYRFLIRYSITGISEEGILKNYQRWRDRLRRSVKRSYVSSRKKS